MKVEISKDWSMKMAALEAGQEIGAGALAADPTPCPFADPRFYLDVDTPCPVCGAFGSDMSVFDKCKG